MKKFKVQIVEEECIGCGLCESLCPDNFEMVEKKGQLKAEAKSPEQDQLGCNMDAAEQCPVNCIHIFESGNKMI